MMPLDKNRARNYLRDFEFTKLFVEELGWDRHTRKLDVAVDNQTFTLSAVAHKRGVVAFVYEGPIPNYPTRRRIERQVARSVHEHLLIFTDPQRTTQIWQWVKREPGRPLACREHTYHAGQPGDALLQKLQALAFTIEDEENLTIVDVTGRVRAGFDVERVTKRFYDHFKTEHAAFLKFIKGIPDEELHRWYASVMLNRLMFVYFIQKKGFLDGDPDYLRNKLAMMKSESKNRFYSDFLCPLFFEGFAKKARNRSAATNQLLGKVPYLNGGIFQRHQIEELHGEKIQIDDAAFEKVFDFFEQYQWHLDERPLRRDNEINPDVLGYIFEKYINQKELGAYYTKEDITGYISQNTVIPFLFEAARTKCKVAFQGEHAVWKLLQADPDRYIYPAVRHGVDLPLPPEIEKGVDTTQPNLLERRADWNKPAPPEYALRTEIWREVVSRRQRCQEVRRKLSAGEIRDINDFITYNLDIRQFAQDVIENAEPDLLAAFYGAIREVTVLDPTCGSGAFLFAALNVLYPLYEACLNRMALFVEEWERTGSRAHPNYSKNFKAELARLEAHPNEPYFILKSIIVNNLYGVDIMEEAVEICKLRLFLKLVAQVESADDIEPLPDIDFNIRAGNTLVGYATYDEVKRAVTSKLDFDNAMARIEDKAATLDSAFEMFRRQQTELGGEVTAADKRDLRKRLEALESELNRYLAGEYGVDPARPRDYAAWLHSHKPFHWFIEFYGIMKRGGFDVIIGNPPYVVYSEPRVGYRIRPELFATFDSKNLYAYVFERSLALGASHAYLSMIVQLTALSAERMGTLQDVLLKRGALFAPAFPRRPESMFDDVEMPVAILLSAPRASELFTSRISRFYTQERPVALQLLGLQQHTLRIDKHRIAKLGNPASVAILHKMLAFRATIQNLIARASKHSLYYQEACRYWVKACKGCPHFKRNGKAVVPPHGRILPIVTDEACEFAACLLNSSLFYWFYSALSDCEHINDALLRRFPIPDDWSVSEWRRLWRHLEKSLDENATPKTISTKEGHRIEYREMNAGLSKPIIDEIDRVLAKHYGFTEEELDFIINYDIKYRMGLTGTEGGEGGE